MSKALLIAHAAFLGKIIVASAYFLQSGVGNSVACIKIIAVFGFGIFIPACFHGTIAVKITFLAFGICKPATFYHCARTTGEIILLFVQGQPAANHSSVGRIKIPGNGGTFQKSSDHCTGASGKIADVSSFRIFLPAL